MFRRLISRFRSAPFTSTTNSIKLNLVVFAAMLVGSTGICFGQDANIADRSRDNSQPVTTTTVNKKNVGQSLNDWFEDFGRTRQVTPAHETTIGGYPGLTFYAVVDDQLQRGFAIDLGNREVVTHLTTNRNAKTTELIDGAASLIAEALQTKLLAAESTACNCVLYAKSQVPSLPSGLTYYSAKVNIINHRFPRVGSVAVIPVASGPSAPYGHVAVVRNVVVNRDGSLNVTIEEANWEACKYSRRTGTPDGLRIQGYFDPAYVSGSASPRLDSLSPSTGPVGRQFSTTAAGDAFDSSSVRAIVLGGAYCTTFDRCVVPNNAITQKSTRSLYVPLNINAAGSYYLYFFNATSGKTSNGKPVTIR